MICNKNQEFCKKNFSPHVPKDTLLQQSSHNIKKSKCYKKVKQHKFLLKNLFGTKNTNYINKKHNM
jgi:hypothetical protein